VRCDNLNNFVDSAPCENCLSVILTLKIKRLVFSSKNNTIISIKPINLEINHKSAGTKFLEKKLNRNSGSDTDSDSDSDSDSKKKNNSKNKCKNTSKKQ
tara:strand:- start:2736 stop:3032 length:297 start_codon:yes stop_codon:yes gene_type:complete